MLVMPWPYLTLLSAGYVLALTYGQITAQASIAILLLLLAGFAVQQQHIRYGRYLGHALFILHPGTALVAGISQRPNDRPRTLHRERHALFDEPQSG